MENGDNRARDGCVSRATLSAGGILGVIALAVTRSSTSGGHAAGQSSSEWDCAPWTPGHYALTRAPRRRVVYVILAASDLAPFVSLAVR